MHTKFISLYSAGFPHAREWIISKLKVWVMIWSRLTSIRLLTEFPQQKPSAPARHYGLYVRYRLNIDAIF